MGRGAGIVLASLAALGCGNEAGTVAVGTPSPPARAVPPSFVVPDRPVAPPLVLMHGMAGFDQLGALDYFYGVPEALAEDGFDVFVADVDPIQSIDVRAQQAAATIDQALAESDAPKVHLIAHSQGGLDARHLISAHGYGDRVASLTTVSTPHRGTRIADLALGLAPDAALSAADALAALALAGVSAEEADLSGQLEDLSTAHAMSFNTAHPDDPHVAYYSAAGRTWLLPDDETQDQVDPALAASYLIELALEGPNDGLVAVESAAWGTFLGELPADHADEVGWWPGTPQPAFDHIAWYRALAAFLTAD